MEEPDRLYGLQETEYFQKLLDDMVYQLDHHAPAVIVRDSIRSSPFDDERKSFHFPFCVVEAKSDRSSDGHYDIIVQTSPPIHACLELQSRLYNRAFGKESEPGPLVWFFSYRGDD